MFSGFSGLKAYLTSAAGLVFCILILLAVCYHRGREIELLDLQVKTLTTENNSLIDENAGLKKSAATVSAAAAAQSLVCRAELIRRAAIEEIAEARPISKPEDAVDDQSSRKAITLLNNDLFAPLGFGLRRAEDRAGSGGFAVPGSGPAAYGGLEHQ